MHIIHAYCITNNLPVQISLSAFHHADTLPILEDS